MCPFRQAEFRHSQFMHNAGQVGGALWTSSANITLTKCSVTSNSAIMAEETGPTAPSTTSQVRCHLRSGCCHCLYCYPPLAPIPSPSIAFVPKPLMSMQSNPNPNPKTYCTYSPSSFYINIPLLTCTSLGTPGGVAGAIYAMKGSISFYDSEMVNNTATQKAGS